MASSGVDSLVIPGFSEDKLYPVEVYTLLPKRWRILCKFKVCKNEGFWIDHYGFSVAGGYENAQLLYVKSVDFGIRSRNRDEGESKLQPNDVLLELNGYKLTGICTYFIYAVMEKLWLENTPVQLAVLPGSFLNHNFDLAQFLQDNAFPKGSIKEALQLNIRHVIYQQLRAVTDRDASKEEKGPDYDKSVYRALIRIMDPNMPYYFIGKWGIKRTLNEGRLLERGEYNDSSEEVADNDLRTRAPLSSTEENDHDKTSPGPRARTRCERK